MSYNTVVMDSETETNYAVHAKYLGKEANVVYRNNLLVNLGGLETNYAFGHELGKTVKYRPFDSDYNLFWAPNGARLAYWSAPADAAWGQPNGTFQFAALDAWQAHEGMDPGSRHGDPRFCSATELCLQADSAAIGAGIPLEDVQTDILGAARCPTTPDCGAYQRTPGG